jgi:hypothetical protein
MRSAGRFAAALVLAVMLGGAAQAEVADAEQRYQMGVSLDTFPDRWDLPRHHVDPLVTTPSSRMTLNAHLDNFFRADEGILLGLDGRVHWRDRAERLEPPLARSEYELQGVDVQALSGYRFGAPGDAIRYDMRVGLGYRGVSRDSRWSAGGADEDVGVLYTQLSGGPRFASGGWQAFLEMGVRVPVDSNDSAQAYMALEGVDPAGNGRRSAGFVSFQNLFQLSDSSALRLDLYYDSQRYGLSDTPRWQSLYRDDFTSGRDRDVFGFEMGVNF